MLTHPIPPHPNPNCCVASNMCSCATNVNTSHPTPPQPRVTMYVAGAQENALFAASTLGEAILAPTQTQEVIYVTGAQENAPFAAFTMAETRLRTRRYVRPEPKTNEHKQCRPTKSSGQCIQQQTPCRRQGLKARTHTHWKIIRPWRPAVQSARRQTFGRHMKEMKAQTVESGPTKPHQSCLGNRHGKSSGRYMKRHVSKPNRNDPAKPFSKSIMWGRNESKPFAK